jgi:hypothetical protein
MGQLVIGRSVLSNFLSVVLTHPFLFIVLLIMPFSNSQLLSNNLFGITGMKPFNLFVVSMFVFMVIKGGSFTKFTYKIEVKAMRFFYLYIVVFIIASFRSFFNFEVLAIRFPPSDFPASSLGFLLSYCFKGMLFTFCFIYIVNLIKTPQQILSVVIALVFSFIFFSVFSIMLSYNIQTEGLQRHNLANVFTENFGAHYNTVATIIMIGVPLTFGMAIELGKRYFVIPGIMVLALILAGSRGALAAAGISIVFVVFLNSMNSMNSMNSKNSMAKMKSLIIIAMTILLLILFSGSIFSIISGSESKVSFDEASNGRWELMWSPLLDEFIRRPMVLIFGLGLLGMIQSDAYVLVHDFYQATHAHNAYLNLLIDGGLIILVPFLISFYYYFRKALQAGKSLNSPIYYGLLGSIVAYMVAALSGRQFFPTMDNMLLFPIIALIVAYARLLITRSNIS